MQKFGFYILVFLFFSCGQQQKRDTKEMSKPSSSVEKKDAEETEAFHNVSINDTLTPGNKYLNYHLDSAHTVVLTWGKGDFSRSENFGEPFGSYSPPWYQCEWKNFIGLKSGCGSDCGVLTVLPMNEKDSIKRFMNPILIDTLNNWIFHAANLGENIFILENLVSGKRKTIPIHLSNSGYYLSSIDTVYFGKGKLHLKWTDSTYIMREKDFYF